MTVGELNAMLTGRMERNKQMHREHAWMVANLMNCHTAKGKTITVEMLLGEKPKRERRYSNKKDLAEFEQAMGIETVKAGG